MKKREFQKVCQKMHDICWIIVENDEDLKEKDRRKLLNIAEQFYRLKLSLNKKS